MGIRVTCVAWLLALALLWGPVFGRQRRQTHWWQAHQRQAPGQRWGSREVVQPVIGYGSSSSLRSQSRWAAPDWGVIGGARSIIVPTPGSSPISVSCEEDLMVVTVQRDLFGTGKLVKISDLTLGSGPQVCQPDPRSADAAVFENPLQACGNDKQMIEDWVVYSTTLRYDPTTPAGIPISRTNPATVPIMCYYPRHGNVSSYPIKPTWAPFSTTVSTDERLSFSLQLMNSDWSGPGTPIFKLGDIMYLEASVEIENHAPMVLLVDTCVATTTSNPESAPRYEIVTDYGCLVDGMQEDASSAFLSPRVESNKLSFTVDAFRFLSVDSSTIYITCYLRAVPVTQAPDGKNKACSYNKGSSSWIAVEGDRSICQCCATGTCGAARALSRAWGASHGWNVGRARREAKAADQQSVATLGPLRVIRPDVGLTLRGDDHQAEAVEFWVLASVGGVALMFVLVAAVLIGKTMRKPKQVVFTVEK